MVQGPPRGYFPDPTKSVLVVSLQNVLLAEAFFWGYGFQIMTGSQYLGGFVGTETEQARWLMGKVAGWWDLVANLDGVECWHPQTAYTGLNTSLQKEWAFVQRVIPGIEIAFQEVKDEIRDTFLPALVQRATYQIPGMEINGLPVKQDGISLPNPTNTTSENWTASCVITGHLVAALRGTADFRLGDHALLMG